MVTSSFMRAVRGIDIGQEIKLLDTANNEVDKHERWQHSLSRSGTKPNYIATRVCSCWHLHYTEISDYIEPPPLERNQADKSKRVSFGSHLLLFFSVYMKTKKKKKLFSRLPDEDEGEVEEELGVVAMLLRSFWKSSSSFSSKAREKGDSRGERDGAALLLSETSCAWLSARLPSTTPSPTCMTAPSRTFGSPANPCCCWGGLLLICILSLDIVMPNLTPWCEPIWPALCSGCTSKLIGRPWSTVVTCGLFEQDITTGNGLNVWPETEVLVVPVADDVFLGGITGLLGGTGGGTPRARIADFLGVVGWAAGADAVPVDPAEEVDGKVALVVTWKVTFPSLLVVVKTLVPAEAETATRGEVDCIVAVDDPRPTWRKQ